MEQQATGAEAPKKSLFSSAKVVEKKTAAKDDKQIVVIKEAESPGISQKLKRVTEIREVMADMEAEGKMLEGQVKEIGKEKFLGLYAKDKVNPGSFILEGEQGGRMMCIVMDKYLSIDSDRADELKQNFGQDTVTTTVEYSFEASLLEKYEEVLSELISNCPLITEEDKANLIVAKPKFSVAKGMIQRLGAIAGNRPERMGAIMNCIQPVIQLKNSK